MKEDIGGAREITARTGVQSEVDVNVQHGRLISPQACIVLLVSWSLCANLVECSFNLEQSTHWE